MKIKKVAKVIKAFLTPFGMYGVILNVILRCINAYFNGEKREAIGGFIISVCLPWIVGFIVERFIHAIIPGQANWQVEYFRILSICLIQVLFYLEFANEIKYGKTLYAYLSVAMNGLVSSVLLRMFFGV